MWAGGWKRAVIYNHVSGERVILENLDAAICNYTETEQPANSNYGAATISKSRSITIAAHTVDDARNAAFVYIGDGRSTLARWATENELLRCVVVGDAGAILWNQDTTMTVVYQANADARQGRGMIVLSMNITEFNPKIFPCSNLAEQPGNQEWYESPANAAFGWVFQDSTATDFTAGVQSFNNVTGNFLGLLSQRIPMPIPGVKIRASVNWVDGQIITDRLRVRQRNRADGAAATHDESGITPPALVSLEFTTVNTCFEIEFRPYIRIDGDAGTTRELSFPKLEIIG